MHPKIHKFLNEAKTSTLREVGANQETFVKHYVAWEIEHRIPDSLSGSEVHMDLIREEVKKILVDRTSRHIKAAALEKPNTTTSQH